MPDLRVTRPYPYFFDEDGSPLDAGYVYIGVENLDPIANPIAVFWDADGCCEAPQPIRTINGFASNNGIQSNLYVDSAYSLRIEDKAHVLVSYEASGATADDVTALNKVNGVEAAVGYTDKAVFKAFTGYIAAPHVWFDGDDWEWVGDSLLDEDSVNYAGSVVKLDSVETGRYIRCDDGEIDVSDFGADGNRDNDGVSDDTTAFAEACAAAVARGLKRVNIPTARRFFIVGELDVPGGLSFYGRGRRKVYNPSTLSDMEGTGCIATKLGSSKGIEFPSNTQIFDLNFYGDGSSGGLGSNNANNIYVQNCGFHNFTNGLGKGSAYLNNSRFLVCNSSQNTHGQKDAVDSHIISCEINANTARGVTQFAGANDTTYMGCKVEWNGINGGENYYFLSATSNNISGGIIDRALGDYGVRVQSTTLTVNGVVIRRSGAADATDSSHFYLENATLILNGVVTKSGADDGGGGDTTPAHSIKVGGDTSQSTVTISGGDMTGCTGDILDVGSAVVLNRGVKGLVDSASYAFKGSGSVSSSTDVLAVTGLDKVSTYNNGVMYEIYCTVRNTVTGFHYAKKFAFFLKREGGSASLGRLFEVYGNTQIAETGGSVINLTIDTVTTDGDGLNINIEGVLADNVQYDIEVTKAN